MDYSYAGGLAAATLGESSSNVGILGVAHREVVMLPLLWCLVVVDLIARLIGGGIHTESMLTTTFLWR
jgi:hypothetical protein